MNYILPPLAPSVRLLRATATAFAEAVDRITARHPRGSHRANPAYDDPRVADAWWEGYQFALENLGDVAVQADLKRYGQDEG